MKQEKKEKKIEEEEVSKEEEVDLGEEKVKRTQTIGRSTQQVAF